MSLLVWIFTALRQLFCHHRSRGAYDLEDRGEDGLVGVKCGKCGKKWRVEGGLEAPTDWSGPWTLPKGER